MSTRVYTGFRFKSSDLVQITAQLRTIEKALRELQQARKLSFLAISVTSVIDEITVDQKIHGLVSDPVAAQRPLVRVSQDLNKRRREVKRTQQRDPAVDWDAGLNCWMSEDAGAIIGHTWGEMSGKLHELLIAMGVADDYGYWNNSDPDESVSEADWDRRKTAWDRALDGKSGMKFSFDFSQESLEYEPARWLELAPFVPSMEDRVETRAFDLYFEAWAHDREDRKGYKAIRQLRELIKSDTPEATAFNALAGKLRQALLPSEELAQVIQS